MPIAFPFHTRLLATAAVYLITLAVSTTRVNAETTNTETAQTTASLIAPAPDRVAARTLLLLGETVTLEEGKNRKPVQLDRITTEILGGRVVDFTAPGASLTSISLRMAEVQNIKPTVVLLFAGGADSEAQVSDNDQRNQLTNLAKTLTAAGARVYVIPSALNLDTMVVANLRIASTAAGATYVDAGSDMGGRPYEEALEEVRSLESKAPVPSPERVLAPESTGSQQQEATETSLPPLTDGTASGDETTTTQGVFSPPRRATAEKLVASQVGEDGTGDRKQKAAGDTNTTTSPRLVTKRGIDASETIRMKPMPALKAFNPKRPVPRRDVDRKSPELAR